MLRVHLAISLPAVGTLVNQAGYRRLLERYPRALVAQAIREQIAAERATEPAPDEQRLLAVGDRLEDWLRPRLRRVINASGVMLHTNLGRAPISPAAAAAAADIATGYSNLELDLATGRRGRRAQVVEGLLQRLTGAEAALVVNNNAAAILLALAALCRGREVIVSRGQQVEIGGGFRMPEVMRLSGCRMVEVGTTNRTRSADYEAAVGDRTAALLVVHPSNFRQTGFTESAPLTELRALANSRGLLLLNDLGSGALTPIFDEPTVAEATRHSDVLTFSADKLLGGPQAGIAVGRSEPISVLSRHALARAVRVDKMTLAALEVTLQERLLGKPSPLQLMLAQPPAEVRRRAGRFQAQLAKHGLKTELREAETFIGGGSTPGRGLPTWLVVLPGPAARLQRALRTADAPVIARIEMDRCCLDLRTVLPGEEPALLDSSLAALGKAGRPA
ncbi:MAG: L-seryl-tRNA(Sec) selenium transferase [Candidatus Dormibacter sp.]|uniref:L-seryl-tRNA(Sec) selenium transferase n=1 Tax=Candidatus Dormibacter sp. TaxID=2973982 RepID=UPI0026D9AB66